MNPGLPPRTNPMRVLLVEDDYDIVQLLVTMIAPLGFECYYALDGPSALEEFKRSVPHLMLVDLMMPGMTGLEVLATVRETSFIPVLMMTAVNEEQGALQAFKAGADDYVTKPFDPKILTARLVAQLRRAYHYNAAAGDIAAPVEESSADKTVPPGWATCERCGYMGPFEKFEHEDVTGKRSLLCPVCKEPDHVVYSLA